MGPGIQVYVQGVVALPILIWSEIELSPLRPYEHFGRIGVISVMSHKWHVVSNRRQLHCFFSGFSRLAAMHDDVIKWKYFPRYWPFVREIHRSPVNFPHKGQWRGALMFTLICDRMIGWVNNHEAGDSRRYLAHCDVIVMEGTKASR